MKKIARIFIAALSAVLMLTSVSLPAGAAQKYYIKTLYSDVNVRSGPGTKYDIVGKAVVGTAYPCLGSSIDSSGTTWYKLDCSVDSAWISGDYSRRYQYKISGSAKPALKDASGSRVNAAIQDIINETAEEYGASGIQAAVIRGSDGEMFVWNYGYATKNTKAMTTDTKLRVASISKPVVAICAMKMQEQGIVELTENISEYWGEKLPRKVTLKTLFSHTSTLKYLGFKPTKEQTLEQITSKNSYLEGKAGSKESWYYNNYAIGLAGSTLEVAANQTLDSYLRENVFEPLDINASFFSGVFESSELATLYEADGGVERTLAEAKVIKGSKKPGNNTNAFAGGLTISAKDTAKLFSMLANDGKYGGERILSSDSVKQMEKKLFKTSENGGSFYQCLPMRYVKGRYNTSELYYHTANAYGVIGMASYDPETKDTVVVLTVGANPKRDKYGVYSVCSTLSRKLYKNMQKLGK